MASSKKTLVAALALLALAALAVALTSLGGSSRRGAHPASGGYGAELPHAARGPVSAALGAHDPRYRIAGMRAHNPRQHLRARFAPGGVTFYGGAARARLSLVGFGYASAQHAVRRAAPRAAANRVHYARGAGLDEWYANGPLGLEQGFDLRTRPSAGRGPLMLSMKLSPGVHARAGRSAATLTSHGHALRYGGLTATDAHGRTLPARLRARSGSLQIRVDDRGAAYPLRIDPFVQQAELTASDGGAQDLFGASLGVDGDTLVVGAPGHPTGAALGVAYVFERPASGWAGARETARLTISGGAAGGTLGDVAISGDTIVAGTLDQKVGANIEQGAAYVFVKPAAGWRDAHETARLVASDGAEGDELGSSVDISGDTVVAAALDAKVGNAPAQGAAYVFEKPAGGWFNTTQTAKLTTSDGEANEEVGRGLAIAGDTIVLSSDRHDAGTEIDQGTAYVFAKRAGGWTDSVESAELIASDGARNDRFGTAIAVSGDTVAVGAINHQVGRAALQGAVYVFVKPFAGWSGKRGQTAELTASDGAASDRLGFRVAVSGDRVAATAPVHQVGAKPAQGVTYLFVRPGLVWKDTTESDAMSASDGAAGDMLGVGIAFSGNLVVTASAVHTVGANTSQGAVWVFAAPPTIAIARPAAGSTFPRGRLARASFSCRAATGATIASCVGPVRSGAPLDTDRLGKHAFTVVARDRDGVAARRSVTYTVVRRLAVSSLRQSARVWRRGGGRARSAARRRTPVGTAFSFRLSKRAHVALRFTRRASGRRRARRAGTLRRAGHRGANRIRFRGRLSRAKRLRPGRYAVRITATNAAGEHASSRRLEFTIAR